MKKLWIILSRYLYFRLRFLGWVGTEIFRQAPPIPDQVVTTDGKVLIRRRQFSTGKTSGRRWAECRSARSGATAPMSRPIGRRIICTAKSLFILNEWSTGEFGKDYERRFRASNRPSCVSVLQDLMRKNTYDAATGQAHASNRFAPGV